MFNNLLRARIWVNGEASLLLRQINKSFSNRHEWKVGLIHLGRWGICYADRAYISSFGTSPLFVSGGPRRIEVKGLPRSFCRTKIGRYTTVSRHMQQTQLIDTVASQARSVIKFGSQSSTSEVTL